ncbi:hypothetical protein L1987_75092 [Smallanthus sonchifolius]|uniref:Uncharacterized protein n=1 Tax=Smallanthus sonchifolius TaxID=185202 RepID=A0ACB9A4R8_9ASTR|nr:hypothetical protein L1987_75092 [Smallanthus sonchifolius]
MTRRPRKPGADSFEPGNKIHELTSFERKKSVTDVVKVVDAPLKKRRLLLQSASPTPQFPSIYHEDSGHQCQSNPLLQSQKSKSKTRLRNSKILKPTNKNRLDRDDFSGIELLATVACRSFVHDNEDHVGGISISKEHTTPPGIDSCPVDVKDAESNGSSIQQNLHDIGKEVEEKKVVLSKELRLHWDLNTVMDEWEEPCDDLLIEPQLPMKQDAAISPVSLVEICNNGSVEETHELIEDLEPMSTKKVNIKASDGESSASKSDVVDSLTHPGKCEDFSNSTTSVLMEQPVGNFESDRIDNPLVHSSSNVTVSKTDQQPVSEECCGSNVTQEEQGHMAEGDSEDKLQAGYDSPFEDGELRELTEKTEKETVYESHNIYKDDFGIVENPLSENVDHGQTTDNRTSLAVKEAVPNGQIKQRAQVDTSERLHFDESRKDGHDNESTSFDVCRNGEHVQRNRSSTSGDLCKRAWDLKSHRSLDSNYSRNYNPRDGSYRTHDRRPSPSERNNGYGSNRGPPPARSHSRDRYRYHSQEYHDPKPCYLERKPRFSPSFNRHGGRPRSRSGSPIAWHFQKHKNLDTSNSCEIETVTKGALVSPEHSSKCFDDRRFRDDQFRDNRQSSVKQRFDTIGYPERLKSDDYVRFTQRPARFHR